MSYMEINNNNSPAPKRLITDDLALLLAVLPPTIRATLEANKRREELLEIVMDLGRKPEARFPDEVLELSDEPITRAELDYVVNHVGEFGADNRAGIERTLHRISCIRNRMGKVVGLTCRIGRAVYGTIDIIRDIIETGKSTLFLGRPGVGKTTKLREVARVLSEEFHRRVVIVDTSNEIAGDGDIPHPGIGRARRMQVSRPEKQHAVMIEAVENHMPEVVVIDEIGTEEEAFAARTIAERGVQLIGTAHGNSLENLLLNPTLSDLIGGIQTVTLSDDEARRRGTQKSVLERKAPPTFDIVIEIMEMDKLAIHHDVSAAVDKMLRGTPPRPEIRVRNIEGQIEVIQQPSETAPSEIVSDFAREDTESTTLFGEASRSKQVRIFPYGVSRNRLEKGIRDLHVNAVISRDWTDSDIVVALKSHYRRESGKIRDAMDQRLPVYVVRSNTQIQIGAALREIFGLEQHNSDEVALREAEEAADRVQSLGEPVELMPQNSYVRRLQHQLIGKMGLISESIGTDPNRRVRIYK